MTNIPIFLSSDDNYAPFVATTIASICDNTKSFCDFYVLDGGISKENQEKICELKEQFQNFSIEFIRIDATELLNRIEYKNTGNHITIATYNRFFIPDFKPDLEKIIYLDVDIIVNDDINKLYQVDLDNYSLGAIWEKAVQKTQNVKRLEYLKLNKNHKYFNAGVLLIDNKKWIKENIKESLFEIEQKNRDILKFADQDILNIFYENNYKILDNGFNWLNSDESEDKDYIPTIRHFNGPIKPWHVNKDNAKKFTSVRNIDIFWGIAEKTPFYEELYTKTKDVLTQRKLLMKNRIITLCKEANQKREKNI